jgi:hypothetical protein
MFARFAAICWLALALLASTASPVRSALPLPDLGQALAVEPLTPIVSSDSFVSEPGFFARWRAGHRKRVNRDGYIETDRPSFTLSDSTVPKGWLQVETGYEYWNLQESVTLSTDFHRTLNALPNLVVRYGWNDWIELRAEWGGVAMVDEWYESGGNTLAERDYTVDADLKVGVKLQTTRGGGWIPKSALVTNLRLPTGDGSGNVEPDVLYIYAWSMTDSFSLGGMTGAYFNDFFSDPAISFAQSLIARYYCSPAFDLFYEFYWLIDDGDWSSIMDAGLRWRPLANLQFDWKIGAPIGNEPQLDGVLTGVGVSFRY